MSRKYIPKRIVEAAFLENIGVVTAPELLDLPEAMWGNWRDRITDHRTSGDGIIAYCWQCGGHLVIPPFLVGFWRRIHAANCSFWAGVMPPMPMFGRSWL
jgi:hypothetical protein